MDTNLGSDLVFLILQFLDEERFSETAHKLEQESGCYFNMEYFESLVLAGEWDTVECYLSSFTTVQENRHSTKIFFEIRKQKYLEALDMKDYAKAVEILKKDLKVFESVNDSLYKELTQLLPLGNIRQNKELSSRGDAISTRKLTFLEVRRHIENNPQIRNKRAFPHVETSRLRVLINQSLNWQHQFCKDQSSNPDIKTLFLDHTCVPLDHTCAPLDGSQIRTNNSFVGTILQGAPFSPIPTHASSPHVVDLSGSCSLSLTQWMPNSEPPMQHPQVPACTTSLFPPQNAGLRKQTRIPTANSSGIDYQFVNPRHVLKRSRIVPSNEVTIVNPVASVNETTPLSGTIGCLEKIFSAASVNNADNIWSTDAKQSLRDEDGNKINKLNLAGVSYSMHFRSLKLPDPTLKGKIVQLLYTKSGSNVLALDSNADHKRWIWTCKEGNPTGKATTTILPELVESVSQPTTHDSSYKDLEKQISCMVLSKNDKYVLSTSGREVFLLELDNLKPISILWLPPPAAATTFALYPNDNNIVAFGLENSKIVIRYVNQVAEEKMLEGHHQKEITSLAFSLPLKLLISAGADGLLCAWSLDGWGIQQVQFVCPHGERLSSPVGVSKIQFHKDQVHLLVVQESQIAIYDPSRFEWACHWEPQDSMAAPISSAQYSCDSQLVYASFFDGAVGVFDAGVVRPLFRVPPSFLPSGMSSDNIYPLAIAAHPHKFNQFAIGLTDGEVYLIELIELEGKEAVGSLENGVVSSDPSMSNHGSELPR